jgi:hypothetical protein
VEESSSSWMRRRSAFDVGAPPPPSPSTPTSLSVQEEKEPRRGGGVELKLEHPPLCLRCRRPTTPIPLHAGAINSIGGEGAEESSSSGSHRRSAFDVGAPPPPSPSTPAPHRPHPPRRETRAPRSDYAGDRVPTTSFGFHLHASPREDQRKMET